MTDHLDESISMNQRDHPWVWAYARFLDNTHEQTLRKVHNAHVDRAPHDAVYRDFEYEGGEMFVGRQLARWVHLAEITDPDLRAFLLHWGWQNRVELPHQVLIDWATQGPAVLPRALEHKSTDDPEDWAVDIVSA